MEKKFQSVLESVWGARPPDALLLGCSGGVDSMTLAHLMKSYADTYKLRIGLAYAHYALRSAADQEAQFVCAYAKKMGFAFHTYAFGGALRQAKGSSLQAEARRLRYEWFSTLCATHGYACVLTAHHLDDDIETFYLNVLRGTSWRGLRGMPQMANGCLRPLLDCSRAEIQHYAKAHNLTWCEDDSNTDLRYMRNRVRHDLMPTLYTLQPQLGRTFERMRHRMRRIGWLIEEQVARFTKTHFVHHPEYDCLRWPLHRRPAHEALLWEVLQQKYKLHIRDFDHLWQALCNQRTGRQFATPTHVLWIDRNKIYIQTQAQAHKPTPLIHIQSAHDVPVIEGNTWRLTLTSPHNTAYAAAHPNEAYLDYDSLTFPLTIRGIQQGDHLYPLGMNGKKKLSDLVIDAQIPIPLKRKVRLLTEKKDIVWVVGHCIDRRFGIQPHTKRILHIKIMPTPKADQALE